MKEPVKNALATVLMTLFAIWATYMMFTEPWK